MPHVSVTVSPASAAGLAETTSYLLDRDLPFNWNFVRGDLSPSPSPFGRLRAGSGRGGELDSLSALIADLLAAVAVIETRLPQRRLIDGLFDRSNFTGAHVYPCAAGRDYLAVGSRGEIAPCHMDLQQPLGDVTADDPLSLSRPATASPHNVSVEAREGCRACTWQYVCAGGCPRLTQRVMGRPDSRSPYCDVYRAVFPELLRLEGLRILKWQAGTVT
jgi:uncharacterized protein